MILPASSKRTTPLLLACCVVQLAGCAYYWLFFKENGYLPSPFVYDKADTFMDLFHTMYWADESGRYTAWSSVYPPLNFLFLNGVRWLMLGSAHESDAFNLRDSAQPFFLYVLAAYAVAVLFIFRDELWRDFTRPQRALIFVAVLFSPPILFTVERGNLIIFALGFLALALSSRGWVRVFAIGMLINIKPYFALYLIAFAVTQRPKELVSSTLMAAAIYLVTGIVLDAQFLTFVTNLFQFSQEFSLFSPRELLGLPSSVSAFSSVLRLYQYSGGSLSIAGFDIDAMAGLIEAAKWALILALFISLWRARERLPVEATLAATTVAITNLGVWVGGYSFIFYACLIPIFCRLTYSRIYLACVCVILLPIDVITLFNENLGNRYSFLSDATVPISFQLTIGAFVRPVINLFLLFVMTIEMLTNRSFSMPQSLTDARLAVDDPSSPLATFQHDVLTRPA
ncbi:DUF2029 domain-containing protein [Bradyrhizobium sp. CCGUVB4N]|uniref:glycosyltransferase 87 family protein n=1 Tax=Bradyrhizobium sp. CCGUVB4N TaxID=2949631 RepID=UPI0020B2AFEF|nr:glycosyltransferase 87 family protein [Bradyrhizobium sp. CCGUVB4N]MCP3384593.1 DUF2029 domain-containing protein [Bradyrhizobium sp. CCGUVB4N]